MQGLLKVFVAVFGLMLGLQVNAGADSLTEQNPENKIDRAVIKKMQSGTPVPVTVLCSTQFLDMPDGFSEYCLKNAERERSVLRREVIMTLKAIANNGEQDAVKRIAGRVSLEQHRNGRLAETRSFTQRKPPDLGAARIPWNLKAIQADRVWREKQVHGESVVVAMLEGGVDFQQTEEIPEQIRVPGGIPCVIGAGGVNRSMEVPSFCSLGPVKRGTVQFYGDYPMPVGLTKPDISAFPGPGYPQLAPGNQDYIQNKRGNSFSAPHIAGVAALMLSAVPELPAWSVKDILEATARDIGAKGKDNLTGAGLVDAWKAVSVAGKPRPAFTIKGVYGNPRTLWEQQDDLSELGINAVFVRHKLIDEELMARAASQGLQVFAEFATLNGKNYVEQHPEAWAINEKGERVEFASWFMGVCPTEPGFRQYRYDELRNLLTNYDIDGVWMDYVHWHAQFEEPEPILPETCFCNNCMDIFSQDTGITLPKGDTPSKAQWILKHHESAWRDWRCRVILDWANEMKAIIKEIRPQALLGLYHCPWNDDEFDGARRRILGLDLDMLRDPVDVFSPMVYHERMGREPDWVRENVNWLCDRLAVSRDSYPKIWPIVQAQNKTRLISAREFETVLRYGLSSDATGVMMFTANSIAEDPEKADVLKTVYGPGH